MTVLDISEKSCSCCAAPAFPFLFSAVGIVLSIAYIVVAALLDDNFLSNGVFITCFILCLIIITLDAIVFLCHLLELFRIKISHKMLFWSAAASLCPILLSIIVCLLMSIGMSHPKKCDAVCKLAGFWGFMFVFLPFLVTLLLCQSFLAVALWTRTREEQTRDKDLRHIPTVTVYTECRV